MLVVGDDQQHVAESPRVPEQIADARNERLPVGEVRGRMIVVGRLERRNVGEVRLDEHDSRQCTRLSEGRLQAVDRIFDGHHVPVIDAESVEHAHQRQVTLEYSPVDTGPVESVEDISILEVTDARILDLEVVELGNPTHDRGESIRPGWSRVRREPAITHAEFVRELVIYRQFFFSIHRECELRGIRAVIQIACEPLHVATATALVRTVADLEQHGFKIVPWRNRNGGAETQVTRVHRGYPAQETCDSRVLDSGRRAVVSVAGRGRAFIRSPSM